MKSRSPRAAFARRARSTRLGRRPAAIARTLHTALGSWVGLPPENEERERRPGTEGVDVGVVVTAPNVPITGSGADLSPRADSAEVGMLLGPAPYDGVCLPERETQPSVRMIAADSIGPLSSLQAGKVIASGWLPAAEVSVLPIGEAGVAS